MGIGTLNRIVLVGPVGRDPDIRRSRQGKKIATLFVVTYDARARRRQWNRVVCYIEALTEFIERHVRKGSKVVVEATLEVRKWLTDPPGPGEELPLPPPTPLNLKRPSENYATDTIDAGLSFLAQQKG